MSSNKRFTILFRLVPLAAKHKTQFFFAMLALGLASGINLLFPEIIRRVLNENGSSVFKEHAISLGTGLIGLFALQAVCFYVRILSFGKIGLRVVTDIRKELFKKIIQQPIEYFDKNTSPDLVSCLMNDTSLLQDAVSVKLSVLVRYTIQVIFGVAAMIWLSYTLSLAVIAGLLLLSGLSVVLAKKLKFLSKQLQTSIAACSTTASESIQGIKILRSFIRQKFAINKFDADSDVIEELGISRTAVSAFFQSFVNFLMNACLVAVLIYGLHLTSIEKLSVGDLTSFLLYGVIVAVSFTFVISSYAELTSNLGGTERVFGILDLKSVSNDLVNSHKSINPDGYGFRFNNVNFNYPTKPTVSTLIDCSFNIPQGKATALVGVSGSGKSTILNLILGFYAPNTGQILNGKYDLNEINITELRKKIGYVPQDSFMIDLSIREAITLGDELITDERVIESLRNVGLIDFVQSLPEGLNTLIGSNGSQISGGQRQRIAIARALVRNPQILILDEITSSLDPENEQQLVSLLSSDKFKQTTQIWVSHRLSSIKNVDHVVVFSDGRVIQEGSYSELINQPGMFQEFVKIQVVKSD